MSGGRVELGIGAGWYDDEHRAYGIPFPPLGERFDRLEEQLEIITGLWATPEGETFSHDGPIWPVSDSPALPEARTVAGPADHHRRVRPDAAPRRSSPVSPPSTTCPFASVTDTRRCRRTSTGPVRGDRP